jgi:hypothetical protein
VKHARIILAVVAVHAVLGVAGWYFVGWSLNRAFQSATQEGGSLSKVVDVAEATVGRTLARGDVPLQPGKASGEGALAFYEKNPERCSVTRNTSRRGTRLSLSLTLAARLSITRAIGKAVPPKSGLHRRGEPMPAVTRSAFNPIHKKQSLSVRARRPSAPWSATL